MPTIYTHPSTRNPQVTLMYWHTMFLKTHVFFGKANLDNSHKSISDVLGHNYSLTVYEEELCGLRYSLLPQNLLVPADAHTTSSSVIPLRVGLESHPAKLRGFWWCWGLQVVSVIVGLMQSKVLIPVLYLQLIKFNDSWLRHNELFYIDSIQFWHWDRNKLNWTTLFLLI